MMIFLLAKLYQKLSSFSDCHKFVATENQTIVASAHL